MGSWKAIITVLSPRSEWFVLARASIRPLRIFGGSRSLIGVAGLTERCFSGRRWSRGSSEILLVVPRALGRLPGDESDFSTVRQPTFQMLPGSLRVSAI